MKVPSAIWATDWKKTSNVSLYVFCQTIGSVSLGS
jgi:hypothetical protein